ncbi:hypothetical protein SAMN05216319_3216 [Duganella sp. CF402]|nr:hypothetical protein EV582_0403 [Duganella sp. BK701]SEL96339.1 hypothetical protein SAMN05216319_3216 [Duganella sp. CF402]
MKNLKFVLVASIVLSGCMATQQMHFMQESAVDFSLPQAGKVFDKSAKYSLRTVTDGGYQNYGEFSNYSWHGFYEGRYQGFRKLPYKDPNNSVKTWLSELLSENGVSTAASPDFYVDVYVEKLKLKSQKDSRSDYRACMVGLRLDFSSPGGDKKFSIAVDGMSKLNGAGMQILNSTSSSLSVSFNPDTPPICKLAIADALRKAKV